MKIGAGHYLSHGYISLNAASPIVPTHFAGSLMNVFANILVPCCKERYHGYCDHCRAASGSITLNSTPRVLYIHHRCLFEFLGKAIEEPLQSSVQSGRGEGATNINPQNVSSSLRPANMIQRYYDQSCRQHLCD